MKRIDFSKVQIFTGVSKKSCVTQDIREAFADVMYTRCVGVRPHSLAFKIYNSKGEEEYDDEEVDLIKRCSETFLSPSLIDAINNLIK